MYFSFDKTIVKKDIYFCFDICFFQYKTRFIEMIFRQIDIDVSQNAMDVGVVEKQDQMPNKSI